MIGSFLGSLIGAVIIAAMVHKDQRKERKQAYLDGLNRGIMEGEARAQVRNDAVNARARQKAEMLDRLIEIHTTTDTSILVRTPVGEGGERIRPIHLFIKELEEADSHDQQSK